MRVYGSLNNRFDENKNFLKRDIQIGDDITMYHWSDRDCYYVTEVINQKHIKVRPYYVCADHSKKLDMGHQEWLYHKTLKEHNKYLNSVFKDRDLDESPEEKKPIEIVYRYNKWQIKHTYLPENLEGVDSFGRKLIDVFFTEKEISKLKAGKEVYRYSDFGNISFGVRDYYYDWSF
jgi:gamma-glutamylcyclotransferase (GGCT)/AIG2-like uncharacterized protein YtfP